jgi:DNA-binding response OmpR family regulator
MNEHILIVEDEEELCLTLGDRLRSQGYEIDVAFDGKSGFEKMNETPCDLVILDIMLPLRSGLDLCVDIRRAGFQTPILILTALSQSVEKVAGLKLGADDYLTKPFDTMELMARAEALLRRGSPNRSMNPEAQQVYRLGLIVMDTHRGRVSRDGEQLNLTWREYQLFRYLVEHRGIAVSREELLKEVWGHAAGTLTRTVDMHIASLRQKVEAQPKNPEMIITVPLIGYKLQM